MAKILRKKFKLKTPYDTPPKMNKGNGFQVSLPMRTTIGHSRPPKRANNEHIPKVKKIHFRVQ